MRPKKNYRFYIKEISCAERWHTTPFGRSICNCMLLLMILIFSNKMSSSCGCFSTTETSPVIYEYSAVFSPCQCEPHNFRHILDGNSKKIIPSIQTNKWENYSKGGRHNKWYYSWPVKLISSLLNESWYDTSTLIFISI